MGPQIINLKCARDHGSRRGRQGRGAVQRDLNGTRHAEIACESGGHAIHARSTHIMSIRVRRFGELDQGGYRNFGCTMVIMWPMYKYPYESSAGSKYKTKYENAKI